MSDGGEGVRLAQLTHGDVLSRPFADTRQRLQALDRLLKRLRGPKMFGSAATLAASEASGASPCARHRQGRDIDGGKARRRQKDMTETMHVVWRPLHQRAPGCCSGRLGRLELAVTRGLGQQITR